MEGEEKRERRRHEGPVGGRELFLLGRRELEGGRGGVREIGGGAVTGVGRGSGQSRTQRTREGSGCQKGAWKGAWQGGMKGAMKGGMERGMERGHQEAPVAPGEKTRGDIEKDFRRLRILED